MQSEAKRFMAALEKRCQLAGSSEVSAAQLCALGSGINLSVPDMEAFIDQLNEAGMSILPNPCRMPLVLASGAASPLSTIRKHAGRPTRWTTFVWKLVEPALTDFLCEQVPALNLNYTWSCRCYSQKGTEHV